MGITLPAFPSAQQAQILRAHQRDVLQLSALREHAEDVARSWLGTRRLGRWLPELELLAQLTYYGLTTGLATQTLGEEYTSILPARTRTRAFPAPVRRAALVLLPALPAYLLRRRALPAALRALPPLLALGAELNLAAFYLHGAFPDLARRVLGVRYISTAPVDPRARPPSYALLGVLLALRLLHRALSLVRTSAPAQLSAPKESSPAGETYIDDAPASALLRAAADPDAPRAEDDAHTWLSAPPSGRVCTLCLEERLASTATECGHLFCWACIAGWARDKGECPLCRQQISATRLLPVYNL